MERKLVASPTTCGRFSDFEYGVPIHVMRLHHIKPGTQQGLCDHDVGDAAHHGRAVQLDVGLDEWNEAAAKHRFPCRSRDSRSVGCRDVIEGNHCVRGRKSNSLCDIRPDLLELVCTVDMNEPK